MVFRNETKGNRIVKTAYLINCNVKELAFLFGLSTYEDGTYRSSRNVGTQLHSNDTYQPRKPLMSFMSQLKNANTQSLVRFTKQGYIPVT